MKLPVMQLILAIFLVPSAALAQLGGVDTVQRLAPQIRKQTDQLYQKLFDLYRHLHSNPELSYQEKATAERLTEEMEQLGYTVTQNVGGHGIVCMLKNGDGPVVMVRTDTDALPVTENTALPYASKVKVRDATGNEVGVMHACGHDMHMTCWVGTAAVLANMKDHWQGTLMFIGQPAEERGAGARMMLEDGLFERFPKPNYALALHCDGSQPMGTLGYTEGYALANVDSVDITIKGRGGHGSAPHTTVDPIVIAARLILDLQTLASREINPTDSVVVTVGSIHGGSKHNIIPDDVKLQLTVRTFKAEVRKHVLDGIKRMTIAAAKGANAPEPIVKVDPGEFTPSMYNDPKLTRRTVEAFKAVFCPEHLYEKPAVMGGEDFSRFGKAGVPILQYRLGTISPDKVRESKASGIPLPSLHSSTYYPIPEPSIKTGVISMSAAVLNLMGK